MHYWLEVDSNSNQLEVVRSVSVRRFPHLIGRCPIQPPPPHDRNAPQRPCVRQRSRFQECMAERVGML